MEGSLDERGTCPAGVVDRRRESYRVLVAIFAGLLAIYVASPVRTLYDSRWSIYEAMSFLGGHDGNLADYKGMVEQQKGYAIEYRHAKPYVIYPIGVPLLAAPFVAVALMVDPGFGESLKSRMPERFEAFVASFYGALAGTFFYALLLYRFGSRQVALVATVFFCLGTAMWSTATRGLWQHGPLILMYVIALTILLRAERRPSLSQFVALP